MSRSCYLDTPVGKLCITETDGYITGVQVCDTSGMGESSPMLDMAKEQLCEYFAGSRHQFYLPLRPIGTPFQLLVWSALINIPYGETRSYHDIAGYINNPTACRAVGMANNKNPVAIIIPCHRVIGSDGSLTGYAGGLAMKRYLLDFEKLNINK